MLESQCRSGAKALEKRGLWKAFIHHSQGARGPQLVTMAGPLREMGRGQPLGLQAQVGRQALVQSQSLCQLSHACTTVHQGPKATTGSVASPSFLNPFCASQLQSSLHSTSFQNAAEPSVHLCFMEGMTVTSLIPPPPPTSLLTQIPQHFLPALCLSLLRPGGSRLTPRWSGTGSCAPRAGK